MYMKFVLVVALAVMSSCTPVRFSNRSAHELRTDKYFVEQWEESGSLKQLAGRVYVFGNRCGNIAHIVVDPNDQHVGSVKLEVAGWSSGNVIMFMEFKEKDDGVTTVSLWDERKSRFWVDRYRVAMSGSEKCD